GLIIGRTACGQNSGPGCLAEFPNHFTCDHVHPPQAKRGCTPITTEEGPHPIDVPGSIYQLVWEPSGRKYVVLSGPRSVMAARSVRRSMSSDSPRPGRPLGQ